MRSRTAAVVTGALTAALVLPAASATATTPTTDGLVISEYVEGSSNNKAIEIYNGTGAPVDLDGLRIDIYFNANITPGNDIPLSGSLADGAVLVVADDGFALDATPDVTDSGNFFNGNDAVVLTDGTAVIDSLGVVPSQGDYGKDVTLRRTDFTRDTDTTDPFDTSAFAVFPQDDVSDLGVAPGADAGEPDPDPAPVCTTADEDLTLISEIQGSNADPDRRFDSPLDRQQVTIRGVVTLADDDLDGYFVQEEPADDDGDPTTSEGLFVLDRRELPSAGDTVELTDEVTASFGRTQLSYPDTETCHIDPVQIAPTPLELPLDRHGREALEGMLVTNAQDLQVSGLFSAYAYGELGLALDGPLTQPTSAFAPDDPAATDLLEHNAAAFLKVNDRDEQFSSFNPFPWERFDEDLSAGDTMPAGAVIGPLNYSFGEYKIEPVGRFPETRDTAPIPAVPTLEDGNDIVSFNVLNYFNTFGDSAVLRGATNQQDFELQTAKIVDAILEMDAAVYGLIEIENDYEDFYDDDPATVPSVVTLVEALNEAAGAGTFDYIRPDEDQLTSEGLGGGGLGPDAIAQALIYQPARATPVGEARTFDIDALLEGDSENTRWPLAQTFKLDEEFVAVVVNHFKSKGSSCTDTAGPSFDFGDDVATALTGNCNLTREYAARRLVEWVEAGASGFPTDDTLLIGDFNAYEEEGPIRILVDAGYTDLVQELGDDAFTYKFDGRYGRLDYAFASPSLADNVTATEVWQINSRAPYGYLYDNSPKPADAYPLYWASSDHDPVVVSLTSDGVNGAAGENRGADRARDDSRGG